jgi:exopolysaccharide biosynthesis protein
MRLIVLITILFSCISAFPQSDSIAVVKADWHTQKISKGITLKQYSFDQSLFHSNQNVTILEIKPSRKYRMDIIADSVNLKITSEFGKEAHAIAALNGTFFDIKNGGSVDFVRVDGNRVNNTRLLTNGTRAIHQKAAIITNGKKLDIVKWDGSQHWEDRLPGEDVMLTGPLLIYDNQPVELDTAAFYRLRHPRSALAIKDGRILLITVDGRNDKAAGMSLYELANFLRWIKADDAINLDGGGSTTLWIDGQPDNGIVNYPSDNKKWDHAGERKVANVIVVRKKK